MSTDPMPKLWDYSFQVDLASLPDDWHDLISLMGLPHGKATMIENDFNRFAREIIRMGVRLDWITRVPHFEPEYVVRITP